MVPPITGHRVDPRLTNLIKKNDNILTRILKKSQREVESTIKTYQDPEQLEQLINAMTERGFIVTTRNQEDLAKFQGNINKAFTIGLETGSQTPTAVMNIIRETTIDSVMKYVKSLDTDLKQNVSEILVKGREAGQMPQQTINQIVERLGVDTNRGNLIARTETMRASNLAGWSQNKAEGATHFVVDSSPTACKRCIKTYEGRVFTIDQTSMLPPWHPRCECVPMFFYSEDEAQSMAEDVLDRNGTERDQLLKGGYGIPADGTGPVHPDLMAKA